MEGMIDTSESKLKMQEALLATKDRELVRSKLETGGHVTKYNDLKREHK